MSRSRRFLPVVEAAQRREQEAARRLEEIRAQLLAARAQLRELEAYRDEYARRLTGSGGMGALRLRDYRHFLQRLGQAIEQQQAVVRRLAEAEERCMAQWRERHARRRALGKVQEGYVREERRAADRQEQKLLDEQALLAALRREAKDG